jgi:hypothetical protein
MLVATVAVSCPELMKLVVNAVPLKVIREPLMKPDPFAVSVNAGPPAGTVEGEMLVSVSELVMVNGRDGGVGPPLTLTDAVPGLASNDAGTVA